MNESRHQEINRLIGLFQQRRFPDAVELARKITDHSPGDVLAWKVLAAALICQGRTQEALEPMQKVIELLPEDAETYSNLGKILCDLGRLERAEEAYRSAIRCNPDDVRAYFDLGKVLRGLGRPEQAEQIYRTAIGIAPQSAEAYSNLGSILKVRGQLEQAEEAYRTAVGIKPDFAEAHSNLGLVIKDLGRLERAEEAFRTAIRINPGLVEGYLNLGNVLKDLGQREHAEEAYRTAIRIKPDCAEAYSNLGVILQCLGQLKQAEEAYKIAIGIKPDYAQAHYNLGNALRELGRVEQAEKAYATAIRLEPEHARAHSNRGVTLQDLGRLKPAEEAFRTALRIEPEYLEAHSNLLFSLCYNGGHGPLVLLEEARKFGQLVTRKATAAFSAWLCPDRPVRLRVGLVSGDFRNHPVGHFLEATLSRLDPERIELIAYATNNKTDELTSRIVPHFSHWKSLVDLNDEKAARLIHADGVQVLIDLSGHSADNRLPMFAWKPAPIQATWLGYLGTTGVAEIDYLLGDPQATPAENDGHFSESVWRLPEVWGCFTPPDTPLAVAPLPAPSAGGITFGCFNNLSKMTGQVVALWARVLKAVPGSRLFLKTKQLTDPEIAKITRRRFATHGIEPERLILEGAAPRNVLLEAYNRVDIALDPFPYGGGTTTYEALWMAVPVITLEGSQFLSRCGVSLATASGLADWIAEDEDDYLAKAVMHSRDLKRLAELRGGLREQVLASPLFDAERFARNLESALWGMWERRQEMKDRDTSSDAELPRGVPGAEAGDKRNREDVPQKMRTFLHVGCGPVPESGTTGAFTGNDWREIRLDVDPAAKSDTTGTKLDMSAVPTGSVDAVFSSHHLQRLYPHEVPVALAEFKRVLKPDGFVVVTCPDLRSVGALIAADKLTDPAYTSPSGPIAPLDILYGHRSPMANDNTFIAHHCGFTRKTLIDALHSSGFARVAGMRREHPFYDLWALATVHAVDDAEIRRLAALHLPCNYVL